MHSDRSTLIELVLAKAGRIRSLQQNVPSLVRELAGNQEMVLWHVPNEMGIPGGGYVMLKFPEIREDDPARALQARFAQEVCIPAVWLDGTVTQGPIVGQEGTELVERPRSPGDKATPISVWVASMKPGASLSFIFKADEFFQCFSEDRGLQRRETNKSQDR
jgi:hypothetical protein